LLWTFWKYSSLASLSAYEFLGVFGNSLIRKLKREWVYRIKKPENQSTDLQVFESYSD
jgi:hypothetical protein